MIVPKPNSRSSQAGISSQDCSSLPAYTGRRARVHHDFGQRFDGRVGMCSCERFDVCEVFWHFSLADWSRLRIIAHFICGLVPWSPTTRSAGATPVGHQLVFVTGDKIPPPLQRCHHCHHCHYLFLYKSTKNLLGDSPTPLFMPVTGDTSSAIAPLAFP